MLEVVSAIKKTEAWKKGCWGRSNILDEMVRLGFLEKGDI